MNNKILASGLFAIALIGFGAAQASANSIIKANLTTKITFERETGEIPGLETYEADILATRDASVKDVKIEGDLSIFGKHVCASFAEKEGKPFFAPTKPGFVKVLNRDGGEQTYSGYISYPIGKAVKISDSTTETSACEVEYEIDVNAKGSIQDSSSMTVRMYRRFTLDRPELGDLGNMSHSTNTRFALFKIIGVQVFD
jgi:hypothetical protein